jgi:hypothetical protein
MDFAWMRGVALLVGSAVSGCATCTAVCEKLTTCRGKGRLQACVRACEAQAELQDREGTEQSQEKFAAAKTCALRSECSAQAQCEEKTGAAIW